MNASTGVGEDDPIDAYVEQYAGTPVYDHLRDLKELLRDAIADAVPLDGPVVTEAMSWGMPTFKLNGNLVHFAAATRHVGLYPGSSPLTEFADELTEFKTGRGSIQLPLDRPLPTDLIWRIVAFRVGEQLAKKRRR